MNKTFVVLVLIHATFNILRLKLTRIELIRQATNQHRYKTVITLSPTF